MGRANIRAIITSLAALVTLFGACEFGHARSITLLGVRAQSGAEVRFLTRYAKSAQRYWSLRATQVAVGASVRTQETSLIDRKTGFRRQKTGLFETHRKDMMRRQRAEQDKATLDQFRTPTALTCTDSTVLVGVRSRLMPKGSTSHHFATQCVLREVSGKAHAKVLMRVTNEATEISLAIPEHGVLNKVIRLSHLELRLRHRGEVYRPLERLNRAWVAFPSDPKRRFFVLLWDFLTPDLPDVEHQQILTLIVRDPKTQKWRGLSF